MKGFRDFILRGNVVDLAVGVVIGAAFGSIVTAFVKDLVTPLIAAIGGQPDFSQMYFTINNSKGVVPSPRRRDHLSLRLINHNRHILGSSCPFSSISEARVGIRYSDNMAAGSVGSGVFCGRYKLSMKAASSPELKFASLV